MQLTPEDIEVLRQLFRDELRTLLRADNYTKPDSGPPGSFMARRAQALERHEKKRNKKLSNSK